MDDLNILGEFNLPDNRRLHVLQDLSPENPRMSCEHFATMICGHRRYHLGDHQAETGGPDELAQFILEAINEDLQDNRLSGQVRRKADEDYTKLTKALEKYHKTGIVQPLLDVMHSVAILQKIFMYEHSGIAISLTSFNDRWDSGTLGYVFVTHTRIREQLTGGRWENSTWIPGTGKLTAARKARARELLKLEFEEYAAYIEGEAYGYEIAAGPDFAYEDGCWGYFGDWHEVIHQLRDTDQAFLRASYPGVFPKGRK